MTDIKELARTLRQAAEEELMCREASDTSDLWQDEASPENVLALVEALEILQQENRVSELESDLAAEEERRGNWFRMAEEHIRELDKRLIEYAGIATREAHRVAELEDENEYVRWRFRESDLLFAMLLITMRAAVIEKEHGEGDRAAMDWIINRLAGPVEFAPESETDAQAYFNRESEIIDSEFSACMDFFMKRNERLRATGIKVKE
ncbi:hypothetical protein PJ244_004546 [Salmonella enterica]|nr:hypothetical protein [Salmonella enterica]EKJ9687307.1 hypothetical protein [Salmonella enterica]